MEGKKLLLIINPCAGRKKAAEALCDITQVFCREGFLPTVLTTAYAGHATELVKQYARDFDLVVCAGGDGTLNETVSGMLQAGLSLPIGYLPCGTTNDLASTLGLNSSLTEAAMDVVTGTPTPIDIGSFNGRSFVYTASFGAFTKASYETPQAIKNSLGHIAYLLEGAKGITDLRPTHACFTTDAGVFEGDYLLGSVSNTTSLAGLITLDKSKVLLDDGMFELLLIDMPKDVIDFSKIIIQLSQKRFGDMLHLYSVSDIHMTSDDDIDWTLDGELECGKTEFDIKNMHRAVSIIVPGKEIKTI